MSEVASRGGHSHPGRFWCCAPKLGRHAVAAQPGLLEGALCPLQPPRRKVGGAEGRVCARNVIHVSEMHAGRGRHAEVEEEGG